MSSTWTTGWSRTASRQGPSPSSYCSSSAWTARMSVGASVWIWPVLLVIDTLACSMPGTASVAPAVIAAKASSISTGYRIESATWAITSISSPSSTSGRPLPRPRRDTNHATLLIWPGRRPGRSGSLSGVQPGVELGVGGVGPPPVLVDDQVEAIRTGLDDLRHLLGSFAADALGLGLRGRAALARGNGVPAAGLHRLAEPELGRGVPPSRLDLLLEHVDDPRGGHELLGRTDDLYIGELLVFGQGDGVQPGQLAATAGVSHRVLPSDPLPPATRSLGDYRRGPGPADRFCAGRSRARPAGSYPGRDRYRSSW